MFTRPIIQMMLIFIAVTSALPANDDASNKRHGSGKSSGNNASRYTSCQNKSAGDTCTFTSGTSQTAGLCSMDTRSNKLKCRSGSYASSYTSQDKDEKDRKKRTKDKDGKFALLVATGALAVLVVLLMGCLCVMCTQKKASCHVECSDGVEMTEGTGSARTVVRVAPAVSCATGTPVTAVDATCAKTEPHDILTLRGEVPTMSMGQLFDGPAPDYAAAVAPVYAPTVGQNPR